MQNVATSVKIENKAVLLKFPWHSGKYADRRRCKNSWILSNVNPAKIVWSTFRLLQEGSRAEAQTIETIQAAVIRKYEYSHTTRGICNEALYKIYECFRFRFVDECTLKAVYLCDSSHANGTTRESRRRKAIGPNDRNVYGSQFPNEELTFHTMTGCGLIVF